MRSDLSRRLTDLEKSGRVPEPSRYLAAYTRLPILLIAYHLGGMTKAESIASAEARALGYGTARDMRSALGAKADGMPARWDDRYDVAVQRLLALRGASPTSGWDNVCAALQSLHADLPEWVRDHPSAEGLADLFSPSTDFICL